MNVALSDNPVGKLFLRAMTMPGDLNAAGTIFGGWIMARLDQAAGMAANSHAKGLSTTAAVRDLQLRKPLHAGEDIEIYVKLIRVGRSSMHLALQLWAQTYAGDTLRLCADATFVMVAIDTEGRPRSLPPI